MTDPKSMLQGVFDRSASGYAAVSYFPVFGRWLADQADIPSGGDVLDVACGRGAVLIPAAQAVGPTGRVVGIDLSGEMARETAADLVSLGLSQATAVQMDAEALEFPDASFDRVLCGFAVQFFADLEGVLSEFRRVLRPRGRLAVTIWGEEDDRWNWYDDLRSERGACVKLSVSAFEDPSDLAAQFARAGFTDLSVTERQLDVVYRDEQEFWEMHWAVSSRAGLERLSADELARFRDDVFARMQPLREPDGFHDLAQAFCVAGLRPPA